MQCLYHFNQSLIVANHSKDEYVVVVFIHNVPVRFVNELKLNGLSRSHPVHVAAAADEYSGGRRNGPSHAETRGRLA